MKKIYVSALSARSGGGVTYLDKLLPLFPKDAEAECHVIASESFKLPKNCGSNVFLHTIPNWMNKPVSRFVFTKLYIRFVFFRKKAVDVVFCPGGSIDIPVVNEAKTVVAFRNMLPFNKKESSRYPLGYIRIRNWILFYVQRASFRKADNIIFISQYAKFVMSKHVKYLDQKSTVIYHGIDDYIEKLDCSDITNRFPNGYVLYVSNIDVYKAQLEVIQAWKQYKENKDVKEKLLLVGAEYKPYAKVVRELIDDLHLQDDVIFLGCLARSKLPYLYENAKLNIYASSCENCPNILLEILASGSPVICSNYQPMPEIGGSELLYYDPYNPDELAEHLSRLLQSQPLLNEMRNKSVKQATKYSWQKTANETWAYVLNG